MRVCVHACNLDMDACMQCGCICYIIICMHTCMHSTRTHACMQACMVEVEGTQLYTFQMC